MHNRRIYIAASLIVATVVAVSCAQQRRVVELHRVLPTAGLALDELHRETISTEREMGADTIKVELEGREFLLMRASEDELGQTIIHDELDAAVITARFRNVTERNGKVDISFNITVPPIMQNRSWQVRFFPYLTVLDSTSRLEGILMTGEDYDKARERGYKLYSEFLSSIIPDNVDFESVYTYRRALEIFIERNLPQLWLMRQDSTYYDVNEFVTYYNTPYEEVLNYFTKRFKIRANEHKKANINRMYHKYVDPYTTEPVRLDSIIVETNGAKTYRYTHTINTRKGMTKAYLSLAGEIWDPEGCIYTMPMSSPLTYYISSLNHFVDTTTKYMMEVVYRNVASTVSEDIQFLVAKSNIVDTLGKNEQSLNHIKQTVADILSSSEFGVDSIVVTAGCSPEGKLELNNKLAAARAKSIVDYIKAYERELPVQYFIDYNGQEESGEEFGSKTLDIRVGQSGESWELMRRLITEDAYLSDAEKESLLSVYQISNLDTREAELRRKDGYTYVRDMFYPQLRRVDFTFYMYRKNMLQDTVYSEVVDTKYMMGLQALQDFEYREALNYLGLYRDINAALTYLNCGYENMAITILSNLGDDPKHEYLLAVCYARLDEEEEAVKHLAKAIVGDNSYVFRSNLDPEVSYLVRKYNLENINYAKDLL